MIHLLKSWSKIGVAHRERKKYEALMPVKRLKISKQQPVSTSNQAMPRPEEHKTTSKPKKVSATVVEHYDTDMKK